MDNIDKKILSIIQAKAATPLSEISRKVGVSTTPCWNRIKRMEEEKLIKGRITVLDRNKINLPIVVFLSISISNQSRDWIIKFSTVIQKYNQITEVHRLTGSSADYILKIVATSIEDYDSFQQTLISEIEFTQMSSSISLHEMKQTHLLPLEQARN